MSIPASLSEKRHTIGNSQGDQVLAPASIPSAANSGSSEMVASTFSSSSAVEWKYDVFLSFRGPDTRKSITYELYDGLQNKRGINTFMDDQDLEVGDPISPTLLKAIEESRFAIVVLSPEYASSTWCLEELVKICDCMKDRNRILPLFYKVDPSHVRYQLMSFNEALIKHEQSGRRHTSEKVPQWKDALKKVASFSGWHTDNFKTDRELVDFIVDSVCSKIQSTEIMLTMATGDFQAFEATRKAMDDVLKALQDDNVTALGVYGMGGVGKTTMVKHVGAEACKKRNFDHVIVVVVSQSPDLENMQQTFAEQLGFKFQKNLTESGRASKLYTEIMRKNNVLIILDDIWKFIDLARIGIPSYDKLKKCNSKVLLTTRILHVSNSMGTQVSIPLSILSDEDSWTLFVAKSRRSFESTEFNDIAKKVAKECKGLPIALIAVARALGDKDLVEWKKAAQRLEKSQSATLDDEPDAYECIKLSYDYLKVEDSKACFLLCCLFPEDYYIKIEEFFRYAIGIGLFRDTETMYEARERAESVVKYLKDSSLLLHTYNPMYIRMHDVIRDTAMNIAKSVDGHGFLVKARCGLEESPRLSSEGYTAVSLMKNDICELPPRLVCPKLQILLLNENQNLKSIPETFLQSLNELRVLDLSKTGISLLPQSFGLLINLRALYLDHCVSLTDISIIGKLTKLEILRMEDIKLKELPRELGELTNLRVLISSGGQIARIPSKVISRLHNLEELHLEYRFCDGESRVDGEGDETNASFDEVTSLSKLRVLKAWISSEECIPKNVERNPNWADFGISIGEENRLENSIAYHTEICLNLNTISNLPGWFFKVVMNKAEKLEWIRCPSLTDIFVEYELGRLHALTHLEVWGVDEPMKSVTWVPQRPVLQNLEVLELDRVDCQELCAVELPPGSLCNLFQLKVHSCINWGNVLLPSTLLQRLTNLEGLDCRSMEEIDYVFRYKALLEPSQSKLSAITLYDLTFVRSICDGPVPPAVFQNLQNLSIERCYSLEGSLFTSDVAQCLFQLKNLDLKYCPILDRIVEATDKRIILPKLEMLKLMDLPMLYYESTTMIFECPSLQDLYVCKCPKFLVSAPDFRSKNQLRVHECSDLGRSAWDEMEEWDAGGVLANEVSEYSSKLTPQSFGLVEAAGGVLVLANESETKKKKRGRKLGSKNKNPTASAAKRAATMAAKKAAEGNAASKAEKEPSGKVAPVDAFSFFAPPSCPSVKGKEKI